MSRAELEALPMVQALLDEGTQQLRGYRATLNQSYGQGYLRLRTYAVVSIGFERLIWQEIV